MEKGSEMGKRFENINTVKNRLVFLSSLIYKPSFYEKINEIFTNPSKLDRTLGTACYSALFVSALIKKYPQLRKGVMKIWIKLLVVVNEFLGIVFNKLNFKPLQISVPNNASYTEYKKDDQHELELDPQLMKYSSTLKKFSGYISDIRIFQRGFSIPSAIIDILQSKSFLKNGDYLNFLSTVSISLYQPIETLAFLFDHDWVVTSASPNVNWLYAVSTRFWFFWVFAEISQLAYKLAITKKFQNIEKAEIISFLEHFATLPLCVHWSLEDGWLDDFNVGLFGTLAGGLSTLDMWIDLWKRILKEC